MNTRILFVFSLAFFGGHFVCALEKHHHNRHRFRKEPVVGVNDNHVQDVPNELDAGDKGGVNMVNKHTLDEKELTINNVDDALKKRMGTNSYVIQKIAKMLANKGVVVDPTCKIKGFDKDTGKVIVHGKGPLTGDKEPNCLLAVLPEMLNKMPDKKCQKLTDFRLAPLNTDWQCGNKPENPNYDYYNNTETKTEHTISPGTFYLPNREVKSVLAEFAEVPDITVDQFMLFSGTTGEERVRGRWCGMPAPPDQKQPQGAPNVQAYWKECVMGRGGYFNVLMCDGGTAAAPSDSTYAVLGIAALNPNVCYAAHSHLNEEAYWQLGGGGIWRTWRKHNKLNSQEQDYYKDPVQDIEGCSNMNPCAWPYPLHNHPAGVVHEMDTTRDQKPMVMAYWWAKSNTIKDIKYHFASYVNTKGSCGNPQRVPVSPANAQQTPAAKEETSVICNPVPDATNHGADYQYRKDPDTRTLAEKLKVANNADEAVAGADADKSKKGKK